MVLSSESTGAAIPLQAFVALLCATQQHESGGYFLTLMLELIAVVMQLFWHLILHGHHTSMSSTLISITTVR